jgi:hypothetical protein
MQPANIPMRGMHIDKGGIRHIDKGAELVHTLPQG